MPKKTDYPELLTGSESRQFLGMIPAIWMELLETEQLPKPVRIAGRLKWRRRDLVTWLQRREPVEIAE
jgi:predicted DNA-binding transcriptional regulator AlpA